MEFTKPEIQEVEIDVRVNTEASETTSCAGGRCVRAPYANDPN